MAWNPVGNDTGVFIHEYQVEEYGRTNCVAVKTPKGLLILSPSQKTSPEDFEWVRAQGGVAGFVAPHGGHTLGFAEWVKQFPNCPIYTAPGSIPRIKEVTHLHARSIVEIANLDETVRWIVPEGSKNDSLLLEVRRGARPVVYINETLADLEKQPGHNFLSRLFFKLLGLHEGFSVNRAYLRIYVKDTQTLRDETLQLLKSNPYVILAHGPVRSSAQDLQRSKELLAQI
ncbi:hypothetical protein AZI86_00465 [Bdellovibrio bacteriovorus]|uniref:Metallo-beta-lactamase domain-containing protein n=1 Tax=Bdellovibrio bacteriovorus TaxID=959 RepID=A0A150WMQ3_BDEBC|nr:hypothetical protein [Bdellovibrio bacteriovorus]KYG65587.1 hypothetical protein AZI86_00465 [Bdellovibrio bacteriovorus]